LAKIYFRFRENFQTKIYENNENFRENFRESFRENAKMFSFSQKNTFLSKSLIAFLQKKIRVNIINHLLVPQETLTSLIQRFLQKWLNCHFDTELHTSWQVTFKECCSVADPHQFYAAPAPGENFDAAPAPTLL
jgi:hypothetical protein